MTPDDLHARLQFFPLEIGRLSATRAGRMPAEFANWFWQRPEDIKAEAGPEVECAQTQILELADGAVTAGQFGRNADENTPFPG